MNEQIEVSFTEYEAKVSFDDREIILPLPPPEDYGYETEEYYREQLSAFPSKTVEEVLEKIRNEIEKRKKPKNVLKEEALKWFEFGLTPIPIVFVEEEKGVSKRPLVEWSQYREKKLSKEEFESFPWEKAEGFALICGDQAKNGAYFCAIDYDVKNVSEEAKKKGLEVLDKFRVTRIERTTSGGLHYIYFSKKKPSSISAYHNDSALELLGDGKLCVMAPSKGYKRENDNWPTTVEDLESEFLEALKQAEIIREEKKAETWFDSKENLPYRGENPPCIEKLLEGVKEGIRNETAIRLASYFLNFKKLGMKKTEKILSEWNEKNESPLSKEELSNVLKSAAKGKYVYGCNDNILKSFCSEECPFFKKEKKFDEETEKKIQEAVEKILNSENQLLALKPFLDEIVVGEDENKQIIFVLLLGSKYKDVKKKQIVLLKGTEGGGKSTLASLAEVFNVKKVGRFTAHALEYSDVKNYDVLYIQELGSMDEETQGVATIKFLSSDDKGFIVEYTVKDESGRLTTEQKRIPAITTISTTTRLEIDRQFERRSWLLNVDETPEQTNRILLQKAKIEAQEGEILLGLRKITDYDFSKEVVRRFVEQYKEVKIVTPFPTTVANYLGSESLRARSDIGKLYAFISLYASLQTKRLKKIEKGNDVVYLVTPEVAVEALQLIQYALEGMIGGMDKRVLPLIQTLEEMATSPNPGTLSSDDKQGLEGFAIDKDMRDKLARKLGISGRSVKRYLDFLEERGIASGDDKKPKTYTILYDVDVIRRKLGGVLAVEKVKQELIKKMKAEMEERLKGSFSGFSDQN
jgi:RecA/RadA recombinase